MRVCALNLIEKSTHTELLGKTQRVTSLRSAAGQTSPTLNTSHFAASLPKQYSYTVHAVDHEPSHKPFYDDLYRIPDTKLLLASWLNGTPDEFLSRQAEKGMLLPQPPDLSQ